MKIGAMSMTPSGPPNSKNKISPSEDQGFHRFVWLLFGGPVVVGIVAANTGYILGSMFIGTAVVLLLLTIRREFGTWRLRSAATDAHGR